MKLVCVTNNLIAMSKMEIWGCLGHSAHDAIEFKTSRERRKSASKSSPLTMRLLREFVRSPGKMLFAGAGVHQRWSLFKHHLPRAQEQQFPNVGSQAGEAELAWLNRDLLLDIR